MNYDACERERRIGVGVGGRYERERDKRKDKNRPQRYVVVRTREVAGNGEGKKEAGPC